MNNSSIKALKHRRFNNTDLSVLIISAQKNSFNATVKVKHPIYNFYKLVYQLGDTIIRCVDHKFIKLPKNITLQVKAIDKDSFQIAKSNLSFRPYDEIENVFAFVAVSLFEILEIEKDDDFYIQLLQDEHNHITTNKACFAHSSLFYPNYNIHENKKNSLYDAHLIKQLAIKENENLTRRKHKTNLKIKVGKLLISCKSNDIINLHFGNYDKIENIYNVLRLYITAKSYISQQ